MPAGNTRVVRWIAPVLVLALVGALVLTSLVGLNDAAATPPGLSAETSQALVDAVEAAAALDYYNARCRSDDSGRHSDNLNKLLVNKLRLTITTVQDELFPEHNYRAVQKRLQEQNTETLRQAGGCKPAKDAGLAEQLNTRYHQSVSTIESLP